MKKERFREILQHRLYIAPMTWVLLGFLISYLCFFVRPAFLTSPKMVFFEYIPPGDSIGVDLQQMLGYSESWFVFKKTPYIGANLYPPLTSLIFLPLTRVDFSLAYKIITLTNVGLFIWATWIFPQAAGKARQTPGLIMLMLVTGLFSYGFLFEIERGQFNVIAMSLCLLAIWIFHNHHRYRYLAYFFFTISVQLKVFPFIFIVMLCKNWKDWKNNLIRLLALCGVNFALLFVLGPRIFRQFLKAIGSQIADPGIWVGNHSIRSYVTILFDQLSEEGPSRVSNASGAVQLFLLAVTAGCILLVLRRAYRQNRAGTDTGLLLTCTLAALIIPSVSHDYKLSILAGPAAIWLADTLADSKEKKTNIRRVLWRTGLFLLSAAYSSTLFSYTNKPNIIGNNFPALFTMLLVVTWYSTAVKPDAGPRKPDASNG